MHLNYSEPLFRPPAEAHSIILQITDGCSWNSCLFCDMYKQKKFTIKNIATIEKDLETIKNFYPRNNRLFLADGDALAIPFEKLITILQLINFHLPHAKRISSYASARNIKRFTHDELVQLKQLGLNQFYIGLESGCDITLATINKGITAQDQVAMCLKSQNAGIKLSVMILNGLGGIENSKSHAIESAKLINHIQPALLSVLALSFPYGETHFKKQLNTPFTPLNHIDVIEELKLFIEHTHLKHTVFRSDHASNYLILKGRLNNDKDNFLTQLSYILNNSATNQLRNEWERGL